MSWPMWLLAAPKCAGRVPGTLAVMEGEFEAVGRDFSCLSPV